MDPTAGVPVWQPGQPKLLDRVRDRCRVRHLPLNTQHSYEAWIRRYILFHDKRHPLQMGLPAAARLAAARSELPADPGGRDRAVSRPAARDAASTYRRAVSRRDADTRLGTVTPAAAWCHCYDATHSGLNI